MVPKCHHSLNVIYNLSTFLPELLRIFIAMQQKLLAVEKLQQNQFGNTCIKKLYKSRTLVLIVLITRLYKHI